MHQPKPTKKANQKPTKHQPNTNQTPTKSQPKANQKPTKHQPKANQRQPKPTIVFFREANKACARVMDRNIILFIRYNS